MEKGFHNPVSCEFLKQRKSKKVLETEKSILSIHEWVTYVDVQMTWCAYIAQNFSFVLSKKSLKLFPHEGIIQVHATDAVT